eukprot:GHUV01016792.1.p1 GENE.GHUV01016792.1~~GHUV01016792.1.p1  ORF type:complete len:668 (+),score=142.24 GHUV01016792.1:770-2773(+)
MYREQQGTGGAYLLLNATGKIGSQGSPDFNINVDAPLMHYSDLEANLQRDVAVLLPVKQSVAFMQELQSNSAWQQHVNGVLIDDTDPPNSYSTVGPFPLAEYAPYNDRDYVWNKAAGGNAYPSSTTWFPMPVYKLTRGRAIDAQQRAAYNAGQDPSGELYHASMKLTMTSYNSANSSDCITAGTCKPLGGYSVWSAIPPVPLDPRTDRRPIILVLAQIDSIDMFHDNVQGADAPLSGLIAMLGALSVLQSTLKTTGGAGSIYSRRVVFLALAGEPWGYMGSRRLLYEAYTGSNNTAGLDLSLIEKVVEIGQVGRLPAATSQTPTMELFAHSQQGAGFGDTTDIRTALTAAAQGESSAAEVSIQAASASNPGIPPSSLMSFLRYNRSIQGVVLAEFDTGFTNPYYASRSDNGSTINTKGIAAAAAVVAGALHRLAGGDPLQMKVNMTDLQNTVAGYVSCIAMPAPGFACPLATAIMVPEYIYNKATGERSYTPKHYIGVLQYIPPVQLPLSKSNMARFLWNVMAFDSSEGPQGASCDPYQNPCLAGQVCAGWRGNSDGRYMGQCLNSTVVYVPSYSTKLTCQNCEDFYGATWALSDAADTWNQQYNWPPDPVWAESDWPIGVPDLQLYLRESDKVQLAVLISGLLVTAVVTVASFTARTAFHKHHKSS